MKHLFDPDIISYSDYYPFGWVMPGREGSSDSYRYGFNGHEKDDEVSGNGNSYTTHYRHYDSRLGRWKSLDPKAQKYPDLSPYNYAANNPIIFIDAQGDTITLAGTAAEQKVALTHLQKLTNDKLALKGNMFIITKLGGENPAKNLKAGTNLIRELNKKGQPGAKNVTVKIGTPGSGNSARPDSRTASGKTDWTKSTNGVGDNATVNFDPTANPKIKTVDPKTGNVVKATRPDEIGLSHELIHTQHINDGDVSFKKETHTYKTASGTKSQTIVNEELRTVGVKGNKKGDITENQIRKEQGLNKRGAY